MAKWKFKRIFERQSEWEELNWRSNFQVFISPCTDTNKLTLRHKCMYMRLWRWWHACISFWIMLCYVYKMTIDSLISLGTNVAPNFHSLHAQAYISLVNTYRYQCRLNGGIRRIKSYNSILKWINFVYTPSAAHCQQPSSSPIYTSGKWISLSLLLMLSNFSHFSFFSHTFHTFTWIK